MWCCIILCLQPANTESVPQKAYHHLNTFFFLVKLNGNPALKFYLQVRLILAKGSRETLDVLENT